MWLKNNTGTWLCFALCLFSLPVASEQVLLYEKNRRIRSSMWQKKPGLIISLMSWQVG